MIIFVHIKALLCNYGSAATNIVSYNEHAGPKGITGKVQLSDFTSILMLLHCLQTVYNIY